MGILDTARAFFGSTTAAHEGPAKADEVPEASVGMHPNTTAAERIDIGVPGGRRLASIPSSTTAVNNLIRSYGRTVIGRSRYLCTNNPYAVRAKETFVSSLVGTGIKPSSLVGSPEHKKVLQELWFDWTDEADHDEVLDFYGLQSLAASELFEAGECFIRIHKAPENTTVPFRLQLLPSEMLPYQDEYVRGVQKGNVVELGIEFNAAGKRVAYHFLKEHPGNRLWKRNGASGETVRVPAEEVIHLFRPTRVGQIRGLPQSVSAMMRLAMLDLYDDAELERKRTTSLFAGFVTKNPTDEEDPGPLGAADAGPLSVQGRPDENQVPLEPGALVDLNPGESVTFSQPADVGASYDPFQYRTLLQIAAGFGVPYANMTGDLMRANYGSIRAGQVDHRRYIEGIQHHIMVFKLCRPVWAIFLRLATLGGLTPWSASEFLRDTRALSRVKWIPPKWDWVDPLKDRQAEKLAVDAGFKSRDDVIEAEGYDPEEMDARIAASQERAEKLGIQIGEVDRAQQMAQDGNQEEDGDVEPDEASDPNPRDRSNR